MIREVAEQAGMSMSKVMLQQVRAGDEPVRSAETPGRVVLSPDEQRSMYAAVADAAEWLRSDAVRGTASVPDLAGAVHVLFNDALDDLIRTGRSSVAGELLNSVCSPERARGILDAAQERYLRSQG